jgi:hypothetical protein
LGNLADNPTIGSSQGQSKQKSPPSSAIADAMVSGNSVTPGFAVSCSYYSNYLGLYRCNFGGVYRSSKAFASVCEWEASGNCLTIGAARPRILDVLPEDGYVLVGIDPGWVWGPIHLRLSIHVD